VTLCAIVQQNVAATPFDSLRLLRTAQEAIGNVMAARERWPKWPRSEAFVVGNARCDKDLRESRDACWTIFDDSGIGRFCLPLVALTCGDCAKIDERDSQAAVVKLPWSERSTGGGVSPRGWSRIKTSSFSSLQAPKRRKNLYPAICFLSYPTTCL